MSLFKSKKFWTALSGTIAVVLFHFIGIDEETTMKVAGIIIALLLGQGFADWGKAAKEE